MGRLYATFFKPFVSHSWANVSLKYFHAEILIKPKHANIIEKNTDPKIKFHTSTRFTSIRYSYKEM